MRLMILQTIQILVPLLTNFALVGLLLLHAHSTWIRRRGLWIHDREGAIGIVVKSLVVVAMLEDVSAVKRESCERENLPIYGT